MWPVAVKDAMQHDAYSCTFKKFGQFHPVRPFPERRDGVLYAGWGPVKTSPNKTGIVACPKRCRPTQHPDWIYC